MLPMMPLSLLSSVEVGEVTEAWLEVCLLMLLPSPPAGGCSVEQGEVLLLARLEEGEILCGTEKTQGDWWMFRFFKIQHGANMQRYPWWHAERKAEDVYNQPAKLLGIMTEKN